MAELDTNFVDAVLSANMNGKKRVRLTQIAENEYIVEDITEYEKVGSEYGQKEINTLNETVNGKVNKVEVIDDLDTVKAVTEDNVPVGCKAVTKFANDVNQSLTWNREKIDNNLGFDITCLKCDFICFINIQRLNNGDKDVDSNILIPSAYKSLIRIAVSNYSSEREAFAELYDNKLRIYAKQGHWVNISILYPVNEHN